MTTAASERDRDERRTIAFGSETFEFSLSFSPRKRLAISVEPDGHVVVRAPIEASLEEVLGVLHRKAGWILRQRDAFAAFGPSMPPKRYVNGETHRYLGRQYRLRIRKGAAPSVKLVGRYFEIESPTRDPEAIESLLQAWFRQRAKHVLGHRMEACFRSPFFRKLASPQWRLRRMRRRWGSCSKEGIILLNPLLVHAPIGCIDYVLVHELCHLVHHNHDAAFYRFLSKVMFEWPKWKNRLEHFSW